MAGGTATDGGVWDRVEAASQRCLARVSGGFVSSLLLLLLLCALAYGPGFFRLPPIDRTEVVFAQSSRDMLDAGRLTDPRYVGERERHRPIGTFWAQMASAGAASAVAGPEVRATIQPYRLPSLLSVSLAVLLTYLLLRPLVGARAALVSAALLAVTPIAALQAQLAIAEGVTLGPATAAQLALLRLYAGRDDDPDRAGPWLALLFWAAQGIAITLNALAVPILSLATLIALWVMDRDTRWLGRLRAWWGVPLMLFLGAPWIVALVLAEGGMPFSGLSLNDILKALGGSQAMKFRAWPLTFTLGLLAGLLFVVPLLRPAAERLWAERGRDRVSRFLLAWLAGYLVYLELISSKPALYSVQVMLPAAATAVALLLSCDGQTAPLRWTGRFPAWLGYGFAAAIPALYFAAQRLVDAGLAGPALLWSLPAAVLLALGAHAASRGRAASWVLLTVGGAAVFLATTFGVLMPRLDKGWTTEVIAAAAGPLAACSGGPVSVVGYREPSAVFAFGPANVHAGAAGWTPAAGVVAVEARHVADLEARAKAAGMPVRRAACLEAINVTRGCGLDFTVFVVSGAAGAASADRCATSSVVACGGDRSRTRKPCS